LEEEEMGLKETARQALGELFIMGFSGLELSEDTSNFISQAQIGGVLLFAHNYENPGQVAELSNQVQECRTQLPLWVSVDHEGGKVQRFRKGFTRFPEAATVGALDSPKLAFEVGEAMARELRAVGVNLNFCPVADIATNPKNPVIGNRAYGSDEDTVSKMITAIARGHLVQGVQPCLKHFPGHGDTSSDSHFALPKVDTTLETLQEREFKPFLKAFRSRCSMVMTAHIIVSKIDPKRPATLSPLILRDILRAQCRYTKVIVSDDMEMKAIADHFGAEDAPRMALEAGCDQLIYRSESAARHAYEALVHALEKGQLDPEIVLASEKRVKALKKEFLPSYQPATISEVSKKLCTPEHLALIQKIEDSGRNY
jgi:beta-N-acetylhexosaminidase